MLKFFTFRLLDAVIVSSVAQRKELSYPALRGSVRKDDPWKRGEMEKSGSVSGTCTWTACGHVMPCDCDNFLDRCRFRSLLEHPSRRCEVWTRYRIIIPPEEVYVLLTNYKDAENYKDGILHGLHGLQAVQLQGLQGLQGQAHTR